MNIIAIDCGGSLGWASLCDGRLESGVQVFDLKRGESPGMRFLRFNFWLVYIIKAVKPKLIGFEAAHHRGGAATDLLVGMTTRIIEACALNGIEHAAVHSSTIKKSMAGKGNASKDEMIAKARLLYPLVNIADDNEADALLLLAYLVKEYEIGGGF